MSVTSVCQRVAAACVLTALLISGARGALVIGSLGTPVTQNFDGANGGTTLAPLNSGGWRVMTSSAPVFTGGSSTTTVAAQTETMSPFTGQGAYNMRDGAATGDRAVGFIIGSTGSRSLMVELQNLTNSAVANLVATWDLEQYRMGQVGLNIVFYHSADGVNWSAVGSGDHHYAAALDADGYVSPPSVSKSATIPNLNLAHGAKYYLRWDYSRTSFANSTAAVGVDNFTVTATGPVAVPEGSAFLAVGCAAGAAAVRAVRRRRGLAARTGR
jgi:hypothetical protein